jgi:hypothetical protein
MAVILSIDWDYMIQASTYERAKMFPDGGNENIGKGLQNYIWLSRYADSVVNAEMRGGKAMTDIKADDGELEQLYAVIKKHKKSKTKMSVHESHKDIAAMFKKGRFADGSHDVINMDYHHDCYVTNDNEIHCGNWCQVLSWKGRIDRLCWVRREDSGDDENGIITDTYYGLKALLDSPAVLSSGIDHIFICRSGVWSPPHLDDSFIMMVLNIENILSAGNIKGLYKLVKRWDYDSIKNIAMLAEQIRRIFADRLSRVK